MLPAHGAAGGSVHERVEELLEHHRERLDFVASLVEEGHSTALSVAGQMRWTRRQKTLEDLGDVHAMTAVLETTVHLDLLSDRNRLVRSTVHGHGHGHGHGHDENATA